MKPINIKMIFSAAALLALLTVACEKDRAPEVSVISTSFSNKTTVQVYNGILNATRNYVYVDGNAVTGAALAFNSTFPSTPANFVINGGLKAFLVRDTLPAATQVPLSFAENMDVNKFYTVFLYDTLNTPKQKTVLNDIQIPADTTARVRFANFIFTRTAVPNVDIYSVKRLANIFTNVNITEVTSYIPYASGVNDTLHVRETGTMNLLTSLNGFNPTRKRSYTLIFRGRYQTTGTTGIARLLTVMANY